MYTQVCSWLSTLNEQLKACILSELSLHLAPSLHLALSLHLEVVRKLPCSLYTCKIVIHKIEKKKKREYIIDIMYLYNIIFNFTYRYFMYIGRNDRATHVETNSTC